MDIFKLRKALLVSRVCEILYPIVALGGIIALVVLADFSFTDQAPLIILGLLGWLGYEIFRFVKALQFRVILRPEGVQIRNNPLVPWNHVQKAKLNGLRFGMDPVIILYTMDGTQLKIPAAIEGLPYISAAVEKNVSNIEKETT
ncbi:MAG: hypothetical protein WC450_05050 [Candidatus Omnitrophota bacterium]|jgi:hypothetical protein